MFIIKKKIKMTLEEIVHGWGSLEAYLEEQRRTNLCELEIKAFEFPFTNSSLRSFFGKPQLPKSELEQPAVTPEFSFAGPVELTLPQTNHLAFIRWLYLSGRLES